MEDGETMDLATHVSCVMHQLPPQHWLVGPFLYDKWDPELVREPPGGEGEVVCGGWWGSMGGKVSMYMCIVVYVFHVSPHPHPHPHTHPSHTSTPSTSHTSSLAYTPYTNTSTHPDIDYKAPVRHDPYQLPH